MKLVLKRDLYRPDGIFGVILDDNGVKLFETLEHAFTHDQSDWFPVLPSGSYRCERGTHRLANMIPFETFEVMNVPGHTGILFHVGNYNKDSIGCILVGGSRASTPSGLMISSSRSAFKRFMDLMASLNDFELEVWP